MTLAVCMKPIRKSRGILVRIKWLLLLKTTDVHRPTLKTKSTQSTNLMTLQLFMLFLQHHKLIICILYRNVLTLHESLFSKCPTSTPRFMRKPWRWTWTSAGESTSRPNCVTWLSRGTPRTCLRCSTSVHPEHQQTGWVKHNTSVREVISLHCMGWSECVAALGVWDIYCLW